MVQFDIMHLGFQNNYAESFTLTCPYIITQTIDVCLEYYSTCGLNFSGNHGLGKPIFLDFCRSKDSLD